MSETLPESFVQAKEDVTKLSKAPDNMVKLQLYALYKQATEGDVQGERPGMVDFVGRAKYDAWKALEGASQADAQARYVELVEDLKKQDA